MEPPVYLLPSEKNTNKKTYLLIKTGKDSYTMAIMNSIFRKKQAKMKEQKH